MQQATSHNPPQSNAVGQSAHLMRVDVLTPTNRWISNFLCKRAVIPTCMGQITVLAEHRELVTALCAGSMFLQSEEEQGKQLQISGGIAYIKPHRIIVFADM